jgi:hypothetical protein
MKVDMLFFLGIFYTLFGVIVSAGWLFSGSALNLYGIVMLLIGIPLVILRPKPPLRFFIGRINEQEQKDVRHHCRPCDPMTGLAQLRPEATED